MALEGWTYGNTIAVFALIASLASLIFSIITHRRASADRKIAQLSSIRIAPLHVRAARRAAYNIRRSVICTANNSNLVTTSNWSEIDFYIKSLKVHIDNAAALSNLVKDPTVLLNLVAAGLVAYRHSSEMQNRASTISQAEWLEKRRVLIDALESTKRRANRFLSK